MKKIGKFKIKSSNSIRTDFYNGQDTATLTFYKDINPIYQILIEAYFKDYVKLIYICNNIIFYTAFQSYLMEIYHMKEHEIRQLVYDLESYQLITTQKLYNNTVIKLSKNTIDYFKIINHNKYYSADSKITNNKLYKSSYKSFLLNNFNSSLKLYKDHCILRTEDFVLFFLLDINSNIDYKYLKDFIEKDFLEFNKPFKLCILTYNNNRKEVLDKVINKDIYYKNSNFKGFQSVINTEIEKFFKYSSQK